MQLFFLFDCVFLEKKREDDVLLGPTKDSSEAVVVLGPIGIDGFKPQLWGFLCKD